MQYIQRLQTAQAHQWDGDRAKLPQWLTGSQVWYIDEEMPDKDTLYLFKPKDDRWHGWRANASEITLTIGDWLVMTESGRIKFMYDEEFRRKYEPVQPAQWITPYEHNGDIVR